MKSSRELQQKHLENSRFSELGTRRWDVIIVGGGLAGGLLALRLREKRPEVRFLLLERSSHLGGDHTWSFHSSDFEPEQVAWLKQLVKKSWPRVSVEFPGFERTLEGGYHSISSSRFDTLIRARLGQAVVMDCPVRDVEREEVVLKDGTRLESSCVIDARGWVSQEVEPGRSGYQKFVGWDVRFSAPHGIKHPVLMDATCPQRDGYRFLYLLPWDDRRMLVEDTRYSDHPGVDEARIGEDIKTYIDARGWRIEEIERQEKGALPIPLYRSALIRPPGEAEPPAIGARGGFVHPVTGYSLSRTFRVIDHLVDTCSRWDTRNVTAILAQLHEREIRDEPFYLLLNRMLFRAPQADQRWRVLKRFYSFEQGLIDRFYQGALRRGDRVKILFGKLPRVPLFRALSCMFETFTPPLDAAPRRLERKPELSREN